jgi:ABC-2 family transporter protein
MSWLVWRQYRAQGAIALVLLAAFAAVMLASGLQIASHWHAMLAACSGHRACLPQQPPLASQAVVDALLLVGVAVPAVLGVLWGAPLVAHELESRTSDFAWAQSVTRTRWLAVKAGWLLLAAAACGGVITALITWWSGPGNALALDAFRPGQFDIQGIVPIGYAVFAMALGIAAGTVARRTLPAIAVALGGFIALRLVIADFARPHYQAAVTTYYQVTASFTPPGSPWMFSQGAVSKTGQVVPAGWGELYPALQPACRKLLPGGGGPTSKSGNPLSAVFSCMQAHGWRGFATYQPAGRYWPFQGIETGIYILLAAALIAVTFSIIRRRDAS